MTSGRIEWPKYAPEYVLVPFPSNFDGTNHRLGRGVLFSCAVALSQPVPSGTVRNRARDVFVWRGLMQFIERGRCLPQLEAAANAARAILFEGVILVHNHPTRPFSITLDHAPTH
ncbi:MAG TPA: hypothetical protein VKT99_18945 [Xanthobacteraceae bacterium]|jgi:hypothetical protein|nr:hypothetical protein [Xanthobacteraceae bacterium]